VSPSQIILKDDLNKVGTFKADINFHSEVKANISIKIDKIQSK
jgi:ribosomal protein L9